ncbi:hypothetical protein MLD38_003581 [Melastoma candidum]|uniref:Uncharacterized protein n=1 Tax=Melastoma candidum TaxID=119954 RepID=A0ACB9S325_9MYRT|nr:hypothetical protein MLD38_003581 [Melastoma candidum]
MVSFPLQGHITPILQLGSLLHAKGFSITIFHPQFNSPAPSTFPQFEFVTVPCGLQGPLDFFSMMRAVHAGCREPLSQYLEQRLGPGDSEEHVSCVIYDAVMEFVQDVASKLNLPAIGVGTSAAASILAFAAFPQGREQGYMSFQEILLTKEISKPESLEIKDLLIDMTEKHTDTILELRAKVTAATKNTTAIIVNTIQFLEEQMLNLVREHFDSPIFCIGPFHKLAPSVLSSLIEEDYSCIKWLDKQTSKSVLYVSFGSIASLTEEQFREVAVGLATCGSSFLWVVRPGLISGLEWNELLPEGYVESVKERGCIVKWAPQRAALAHQAVGGFWTHCGWNSILESVCEGVPMICWPAFGDQGLDSRYVCRIWKIGVELDELEHGRIAAVVSTLMADEDISRRAQSFKEKAELSLSRGGSTERAVNELVELLRSFRAT